MTGRESLGAPGAVGKLLFAPTHWSVVLAAAGEPSSESAAALEQLCRSYWYPLYVYVRRRGFGPQDAQDLTQEFFARVLANRGLRTVTPLKGKFRAFLLACMNHLLSDERDRATRQKRGGGQPVISFDAQTAEERYRLEPLDELSPEKVYERRCAAAIVERVLTRLEQEYAREGKAKVYRALHQFLTRERTDRDYTVAAQQLGTTQGAARVAVHRLRHRFGIVFRETVAETLDGPQELEAEMRYLLGIFSG